MDTFNEARKAQARLEKLWSVPLISKRWVHLGVGLSHDIRTEPEIPRQEYRYIVHAGILKDKFERDSRLIKTSDKLLGVYSLVSEVRIEVCSGYATLLSGNLAHEAETSVPDAPGPQAG